MALALAATVIGFRGALPGGPFDLGNALRRYRDILSNPRAPALFSLVFVEAIAIFGIFPYVAPLLEERGGGGPTEAGFALGGFAIGGLVYSALVRWMLRRLGLRPNARRRRRRSRRSPWSSSGSAATGSSMPPPAAHGPRLLHAPQHLPGPGDRGRAERARLRGGAARLLVLLRSGAGRRGRWASDCAISRAGRARPSVCCPCHPRRRRWPRLSC